MEHAVWLEAGFDPAQARFLMVTAITHHQFDSQLWGECEVLRLYAELTEIEVAVLHAVAPIWPDRRRQHRLRPVEARPGASAR